MSFLAIPQYLWKRAFIGQEDESEGRWVTIRGVHVFIREGETVDDAINYLKVREFEKNYFDNVARIKLTPMTPEGKQKFLDENINKPLKEGYATLPKFFRGSSDNEIFDYLRTGKFQSMREQQWKDGYTSLTLSPKIAHQFAYLKDDIITEFESYAVRGKSKPAKYLSEDYKDNFGKIRDGTWSKENPSHFIDEAEIKARNLSPFPNAITVYVKNPKQFYNSMISKYKSHFVREPPASFMGRLNNIKIRPMSEFEKKYGML